MKSGVDVLAGVCEDPHKEIKPLASVIIPHYELHDMLRSFCLPNIYLFAPMTQVIVVDNGSKSSLELDGPQKVITSKERLSFAKACNVGAKEADTDILIFLNNDCQVLPGWLEPILASFEDKKVVICGAKLLNGDGTLQHVGIAFGKKRLPYHPRIGERDNPKENKTIDALAVTGALMAVRKSWFDEVGGFPEEYPNGNYEDVDLCLQAKKGGYKIKVALSSKAIHFGCASYQLHPDEHTDLLVRRNFEILREKWKAEPNSFFGIGSRTKILPWEERWKL